MPADFNSGHLELCFLLCYFSNLIICKLIWKNVTWLCVTSGRGVGGWRRAQRRPSAPRAHVRVADAADGDLPRAQRGRHRRPHRNLAPPWELHRRTHRRFDNLLRNLRAKGRTNHSQIARDQKINGLVSTPKGHKEIDICNLNTILSYSYAEQ